MHVSKYVHINTSHDNTIPEEPENGHQNYTAWDDQVLHIYKVLQYFVLSIVSYYYTFNSSILLLSYHMTGNQTKKARWQPFHYCHQNTITCRHFLCLPCLPLPSDKPGLQTKYISPIRRIRAAATTNVLSHRCHIMLVQYDQSEPNNHAISWSPECLYNSM